jgi:hypothetical protein
VAVKALREIWPQLFNLKAIGGIEFYNCDAHWESFTMRKSATHDESIGVVIDQRVVEIENGETVHDFWQALRERAVATACIWLDRSLKMTTSQCKLNEKICHGDAAGGGSKASSGGTRSCAGCGRLSALAFFRCHTPKK